MTDYATPMNTVTAAVATIPNSSTAQQFADLSCRLAFFQNTDATASVFLGDSSVTSAGAIAHTYHKIGPGAVLTLEVKNLKMFYYISSAAYTGPFYVTAYNDK